MSPLKIAQLSSSEAIEKLRLNYDSALLTANEQHAQEVAGLQMQLGAVREQLHQLVVKRLFVIICDLLKGIPCVDGEEEFFKQGVQTAAILWQQWR